MSNSFIILRGPSGSGKTTIARRLFARAARKVAIIHQDYYRFIFNPAGGGSKTNASVIHQMIEHNCSVALAAGYDVILEGILTVKAYATILDHLMETHDGPSFMFYFDISFDETARRHQTRKTASDFTVDDMKSWYPASRPSKHPLEHLIPEHYAAKDTVRHICAVTKLCVSEEVNT